LLKPGQDYFHDFINLIFPQLCPACGNVLYRYENVLCLNCLDELPRTRFHNDPDNEVSQLFWGRVPVKNVTSFIYFNKGSRYQHILHELKYKGQQHIGIEMGRLFGNELKDTSFSKVDVIHPVPLHYVKQRKRGYNQSELIARGIAEILHKPLETNLISRVINTATQTMKSRYERWENVEGIFKVARPEKLENKHILLVDDVVTTGSTLEACASAVLDLEKVTVSIATLACAKLQ
jgi:ComF family protein